MAKWDIKDSFWCMDYKVGEEWNFAYMLPQEPNKPTKLVIPKHPSKWGGWNCHHVSAATETVRDIASDYCNTPIGSLPLHKFDKHLTGDKDYNALPTKAAGNDPCRYGLEVYVDEFTSIVIPMLQEQLTHVGRGIMAGFHNVFPADIIDKTIPSLKEASKRGGAMPSSKHFLVLILMDSKRQCGWKNKRK